jgi:hypothetical protein
MDAYEKDKMCADALHLWGINVQMLMGIEEAAELILGICKLGRGQKTKDNIAEEIADNRVMAYEVMYVLGITEEEVKKHEGFKWARLHERVEEEKLKRHNRGQ